jgi:hypothetical protein
MQSDIHNTVSCLLLHDSTQLLRLQGVYTAMFKTLYVTNDITCITNVMCYILGIILRWILRKWEVGVWTGWSWIRIGTGGRRL